MSRVGEVWKRVKKIFTRINEMPNVFPHLCGVSRICVLLAVKRGENVELAEMAGVLHDIAYLYNLDVEPYNIQGITSQNHAEMGAEIAMQILLEINLTSEQENEIICGAIRKHDDKNNIDTPFDELLKDADVFDHGLCSIMAKKFRGERWDKVCQELGMNNCR